MLVFVCIRRRYLLNTGVGVAVDRFARGGARAMRLGSSPRQAELGTTFSAVPKEVSKR